MYANVVSKCQGNERRGMEFAQPRTPCSGVFRALEWNESLDQNAVIVMWLLSELWETKMISLEDAKGNLFC